MKRHDVLAKQIAKTDWSTYITRVLAFIGLWQILANGHQWLMLWLQ
ncbi:hypothetical protein [Gloeocapsa sp. PCC 73106]|nr:hypothetical protein [Gloeocapsa sp. PCC 73106]ELR96516.1 hypothetical protein GLO73106DRAFT_00003100 [Gloeocapsa sp. PCC 73106]